MPLFISLKVSLLATLLTVVTAVPTAYGLSRYLSCHRGRGAALIDSLLLLPLVLPPTVIGFGLLWLLGAQGPLGFLATNVVFTWRAAVLTAFVVSFPLMYRAARAAFSQIDESLFGVARTLGASEWRVFYQVALPLAKPGMLSGVLLSFARSLGEFGATLMLAGNIPGKTQTLPMAVYFAVEGGDFRTAAQWSGVMGAIALFTVFLANYVSDLSTLPTLTFPLMTPPLRKDSPEEEVLRGSTQDFLAQTEQQGTPSKVIPSKVIPLTVDITKTLSRFTLRIQFSTSDALIGILGASGAGKSLLLRCLAGVETPDSGRIVLGDRILYDSDRNINLPSRQRKIALLFQNYALFPHLTVAQNVAFGAKGTDTDTKRQVSAELAAVEMAAFAQHYYPHQLSGGQQQRIALARALVSRPDLLLLDEPFSALDVHLRSRLGQQLFQRLAHYSGTTLLVSHHLSEAYRTDQLLVIDQGEVIRQAEPVEVFERPHRCAIAKLTGPLNQSSAYLVEPDYPIEPDSGLYLRADDWQMTLRLSPTSEIPSEMPSLTSSLTSSNGSSSALYIGVRPENVFFVTGKKYLNFREVADPTAKIAYQPAKPNQLKESHQKSKTSAEIPIKTQLIKENYTDANKALCWLADICPQPGNYVLSLKLHHEPTHATDYHLQAIVTPHTWAYLSQQPLPWTVYLPPENLIVLRP